MSRPVAFLESKRLYLRTLQAEDVEGAYPGWLNDRDVCQGNSHHVYPYTRQQAAAYVQHAATTLDELVLAVVLKDNNLHIGNVALQKLNWICRTAEFSILLGDRAEWGKGYGLEASRVLLHHAFTALNLTRVACATFHTNVAMRKLALSLGMLEEGVRRRAAYKDGRYLDTVEFGVLRDEFLTGQEAANGREQNAESGGK